MTSQSLFGVGEGLAAGVAEGLEDLADDFEDFDEDLDLAAKLRGLSERHNTPAMRTRINRGVFISYKGAGWVP